VSTPPADPWIPRPWRVREARADTADVFSWEIEPVQGPTPDFRPGQFNMLYAFGQGEVAVSICGPGRLGGLRHTVRAVGAVTRALQALTVDSIVGVRGPFGRGWPVDDIAGRNVVLAAGGLGLAPLRPIMEWMLARRAA
jgi:NAD(P)H-flavin reductase